MFHLMFLAPSLLNRVEAQQIVGLEIRVVVMQYEAKYIRTEGVQENGGIATPIQRLVAVLEYPFHHRIDGTAKNEVDSRREVLPMRRRPIIVVIIDLDAPEFTGTGENTNLFRIRRAV